MKKLYTLILSIALFSGATKAQVTLTKAANEPVLGDVVSQKGFDSTGVVPKTTGPAQTWNFSAFTSNTVTSVSTYTTVASTPSAASFPLASLAQSDGNGVYTYFNSTPSSFELNGVANNVFAITFTNNAIAAQWPITYLYSNTDTYSGVANASTLTGVANGTINTTAPGNGTLMLPGGITYTNVLQVKTVNNLKATVGTFPTAATITIVSTEYTYYTTTQKYPVLTVSYSKQTLSSLAGPTVTSTSSIKINDLVYAGINELTLDNSYSIYPNPTTSYFTVSLDNKNAENVSVEIFNQLGQSVKKENLGTANVINNSVSTAELSSGVYFIRTNMGNKSSVKKLIIQ